MPWRITWTARRRIPLPCGRMPGGPTARPLPPTTLFTPGSGWRIRPRARLTRRCWIWWRGTVRFGKSRMKPFAGVRPGRLHLCGAAVVYAYFRTDVCAASATMPVRSDAAEQEDWSLHSETLLTDGPTGHRLGGNGADGPGRRRVLRRPPSGAGRAGVPPGDGRPEAGGAGGARRRGLCHEPAGGRHLRSLSPDHGAVSLNQRAEAGERIRAGP